MSKKRDGTILKFLLKSGLEKDDAEFIQDKYDRDTGRNKTQFEKFKEKVLDLIFPAALTLIAASIGMVVAYFEGFFK